MKVKELVSNPKNPRTITDAKLKLLEKTLAEFGDLSGVVFNRKTKQLVGGHQRLKHFRQDAAIIIEKKYAKPTKTGTIAEGFIDYKGERFRYREVHWDEKREKAANLAANKGAGEWDFSLVGEWMRDLQDLKFDLDLTGFGANEREPLLHELEDVNFEAGTEADQGKLDQKKPVTCPHCGEDFVL